MSRTDDALALLDALVSETEATEPILRFFRVPTGAQRDAQKVCASVGLTAVDLAKRLPKGIETQVALRRLLDARDAALRALQPAAEKPATPKEKWNTQFDEVVSRVRAAKEAMTSDEPIVGLDDLVAAAKKAGVKVKVLYE